MYFLSPEKIRALHNKSVVKQKADTRLLTPGEREESLLISAVRRREREYPPAFVIVLTGSLKNVLAASLLAVYSVYWRVTEGARDH